MSVLGGLLGWERVAKKEKEKSRGGHVSVLGGLLG